MPVAFKDERSGKSFSGTLDAGRAALLLISDKGELLTPPAITGTETNETAAGGVQQIALRFRHRNGYKPAYQSYPSLVQ